MPLANSLVPLPPPEDSVEFDDMVTEALRVRHNNLQLTRLGRSGQGQDGIDGWDPMHPQGLVWQSTAQKKKLVPKLKHDLEAFDKAEAFAGREPFIFAMAVNRDAAIQKDVMAICAARYADKKCLVEPLFWEDIWRFLPEGVKREHYPQWVPPSSKEQVLEAVAEGLLALGNSAIFRASLIESKASGWTVRLGEFVVGTRVDVAEVIDRFDEPWVSFEGLGTARSLAEAPTLRNSELRLTVGPRPERDSVHNAGVDIERGPDGDMFPDGRTISGFRAAIQHIGSVMSTKLGEWFLDETLGTRCSEFYWRGFDPKLLGSLFAVELARLAFVPRKEGLALPCIEKVIGIEVPSMERTNNWLQTIVTVDLTGHGEWTGPVPVFVGDGRERGPIPDGP
jgi:hypothetical protein